MLATIDFPRIVRRILLIHADDAVKEMLLLCLETIPNCEVITINFGIEAIEKGLEADIILARY